MRAYYNNGVSFRDSLEPEFITEGEVYFGHIPTEDELIAAFPNYLQAKVDYNNQLASIARASAYKLESDPLFFKWQRGESTEQEWLDKVAEIKAQYPKETL